MSKHVLSVLMTYVTLSPFIIIAQPDTVSLRLKVDNLQTLEQHRQFWNDIHYRDQDLRKREHIRDIDFENLVLVSYYFNKFGYPDTSVTGKKGRIINMVWAHNKFSEVSKLTYPIILHGYLRQMITEDDVRDYYLRILYQHYYDDHGNQTKSFAEIYKALEPNLSDTININKVIRSHVHLTSYFEQEKRFVGQWKIHPVEIRRVFNGKEMVLQQPAIPASIYQLPDKKYFFEEIFQDQSFEPMELICMNENETLFTPNKRENRRVYRIDSPGNLHRENLEGETEATYEVVGK